MVTSPSGWARSGVALWEANLLQSSAPGLLDAIVRAYLFEPRTVASMIASVRAAAVQLRAHDRDDFPLTLDRIIEAASEAASRADLVVLPESTFPAYVLGGSRLA
ncbi:MAG: hypothetical protein WB810_03235, partial [Candidatus Cybelea sp.]